MKQIKAQHFQSVNNQEIMLLPKVINLICVKNVARPLLISTRNYPGMKHEVYDYIQWVRPAKIPATDPLKSGDLDKMKKIDGKELLLNFEKSKLLESANELVRSKFSVELNPRKEAVRLYVDEMIKKVQRHDSDYGSMEAKCKLHNFFNNKHPVMLNVLFLSGKNDSSYQSRSSSFRRESKK